METEQDTSGHAASSRRKFLRQSLALGGAAAMPSLVGAQGNAKTIKIGVIVGLSGPGAPYGNDALNGVQTIVDLVNKSGGIKRLGGAQIQIESADHQGKPDVAQTLVERLAPGVVGFVGCAGSASTILATQAAERLKIPFITADQDDRIVDRNFNYTFKVTARMVAITESSVDFMKYLRDDLHKPLGKIGIIYSSEEPHSITLNEAIQRLLPKAGFQISESIGVPLTASDFVPTLQRLRDAGTETLYWNVAPAASLRLVGGLKQLRWHPYQLPNTGGPILKFFSDQLGDYVDGLLVVGYFAADTKLDAARKLNEVYKQKYAKDMATLVGSNASAASVLVAGLEAAGSTDGTALANAIRGLNLKPGDFNYCMPGGAAFDKAGQNTRAQTIVTVIKKGGQQSVVWPKEMAAEPLVWKPI